MWERVFADQTQTAASETSPCACNPKSLSGSLYLLKETIGLQLFLEKLQGQEEQRIFQNYDSVERPPLPKAIAFPLPFSVQWVIRNY